MSDLNKLFVRTASSHRALGKPYDSMRAALQMAPTVDGAAGAKLVLTAEGRSDVPEVMGDALAETHESFRQLFRDLHDSLSVTPKTDAKGRVVLTTESLDNRVNAAFAGMLMAGDTSGALLKAQTLGTLPASVGMNQTVHAIGSGFHDRRAIYTSEAFQNYDMQNSRVFSALFNYSIVDFDDFTRTFWRPVTISPDSTYVELLINVLTVFNGIEQRADGKSQSWNRANLVRAIADHTILHTDLTRAIPVHSVDTAWAFMTKVAPVDIDQAGNTVTTAPLLASADGLNLIALSQPGWLVRENALDQRDGLDPGSRLEQVYIALEDDVLVFNVDGIPGTEFSGTGVQGDQQRETLSWTTASLKVTKSTKNADGSALSNLASVVTGELILSIRLDIHADLNRETGDLILNTGKPTIRSLLDKDGNVLAKTDARYVAVSAALAGWTEVGVVPLAYRDNSARRQRGQLINIRQFAERVVVPWRDPVAVERPSAGQNDQDTSDLTALLSACRIRIQNESVTALLDAEMVIASTVVDQDYNSFDAPATLGAGRHFVLPYHNGGEVIDAELIVDSVKSSERNADIQAGLVAKLRNGVAKAYTKSQYKAASDALSGGTAPKPKVALVTDPVTARYLIEPGELRTLVDFELIVVPILDFRLEGKIKMVFISDDGGTDVNFLNFGYLFFSPEHVLVANLMRSGAFNRETQVAPRYRHYVACPVMLSYDVINIDKVLAKVTINTAP